MKRNTIYRIIAVLILITLIIGFTVGINDLFFDKEIGSVNQFKSFYAQEDDTIDVLNVGSSRVHCNIEPVAMWENFGIPAYDLSTSSQSITYSYYAIKEALKTQKPKVIFLEYSQILKDDDYPDDYQMSRLFGGMKLSVNKIKGMLDHNDKSKIADYLFEISMNHTRYSLINKDSFVSDMCAAHPIEGLIGHKGATDHTHKVVFEGLPDGYTIKDVKLTERVKSDIDRINKLCKSNEIYLVMVWTPDINRTQYPEIVNYIKELGIEHIDCNDYYEEMGIDPSNDFIEEGHLNMFGSMKVGEFLGKYAKEKYNLPDRRGEARYSSWDDALNYRNQHLLDIQLASETGLGNYFSFFPNENYIVAISLMGDYYSQFVGQEDALLNVGCNHSAFETGGTFVSQIDKVYYYGSIDSPKWIEDIGNRVFEVYTDENAITHVFIDGIDYTVTKENGNPIRNGIQVIVYNKLSEKVIDAVAFDADRDYAITRNR